jgi:hypothetical protein
MLRISYRSTSVPHLSSGGDTDLIVVAVPRDPLSITLLLLSSLLSHTSSAVEDERSPRVDFSLRVYTLYMSRDISNSKVSECGPAGPRCSS